MFFNTAYTLSSLGSIVMSGCLSAGASPSRPELSGAIYSGGVEGGGEEAVKALTVQGEDDLPGPSSASSSLCSVQGNLQFWAQGRKWSMSCVTNSLPWCHHEGWPATSLVPWHLFHTEMPPLSQSLMGFSPTFSQCKLVRVVLCLQNL